MKKYLLEALTQKYPNAEFNYEPETEQLTWLKNEVSESKLIELEAEYDAQEYARNRATAYPAIADQLDEIYHNGIDSWKAVIKVTKDKYPKG